MNRRVTDQMDAKITIPDRPRRIISLVPSQTELLFDLGLADSIVGVTRFCIHPEDKTRSKERIGGTKDFDFDKIKALNPDLIIGNKEENYEEGINELKKHFAVWMSDIYTLEDAYEMMRSIGDITGKTTEANSLVSEITAAFQPLRDQKSEIRNRVAYFIWRKPYMVAARGTFIDHMLGVLGWENVFGDNTRYPEVTAAELAASRPDHIFLSSEPYAFSEKHIDEFQAISPASQIHIVDGEMFSWYGSRLRLAPEYFGRLHSTVAGL